MRHSNCWRTQRKPTQSEKGDSNVDEIESVYVRIVRGRGLQVRLPEREDLRPEPRLQVWRQMQLRSRLQLQSRLG